MKLVQLRTFSEPYSRHMAGYAWAHNSVSYFHDYHSGKVIGIWFMVTAITGGCLGVFSGGYLSDLLVTRLGVHSRLWLLGVATVNKYFSLFFVFRNLFIDSCHTPVGDDPTL